METAPARTITLIPAKPEIANSKGKGRQLRVAAYCRVSTDDEEQLTSYEAQKTYYTDKIMSNREWTMAGIYADEGITGTSTRKRKEFLKMIRKCKQHKIDIILAKSISRFARNTVDCLNYVRVLREMGIAVIFEKENINTLETDSELLTTMMSAFAQAESESISANVRWGKRQAMKEGKVSFQICRLYGYREGEDGQPEIVPEEAEVVRRIFQMYLAGESVVTIKKALEEDKIPTVKGKAIWPVATIQGMLRNEKYCGDVLMQKTFVSDCIGGKVIKNTGQLPMYLIRNNHVGIIDRATFDRTQAEIARRAGTRTSSPKNSTTGLARYSSKYALTERLVCGECGTIYRRCTWTTNGEKRIVWRCLSRLDYGKKYCHHSPTMDEDVLQDAILSAVNSMMPHKQSLVEQLSGTIQLELAPIPGEYMSVSDIDRRLSELNQRTTSLMEEARDNLQAYADQFKAIMNEAADLKSRRKEILEREEENANKATQLSAVAESLNEMSPEVSKWDENIMRQLVESVTVLSKDLIKVTLLGGAEIEQAIVR